MKIKKKQKLVKEWFIKLQNIICNNIEKLENEYGSKIKFKEVNLDEAESLFKTYTKETKNYLEKIK